MKGKCNICRYEKKALCFTCKKKKNKVPDLKCNKCKCCIDVLWSVEERNSEYFIHYEVINHECCDDKFNIIFSNPEAMIGETSKVFEEVIEFDKDSDLEGSIELESLPIIISLIIERVDGDCKTLCKSDFKFFLNIDKF